MQADGSRRSGTATDMVSAAQRSARSSYTATQGQYLAFIYYYTKIHGRSRKLLLRREQLPDLL